MTLPTGEWVHVAITTNNDKGEHNCYINGKLKQSLTGYYNKPNVVPGRANAIGGNNIPNYFPGEIYSIALYNDVRSEREIKRDATSPSPNGLVAAWNLSGAGSTVKDISGNGYDATR